MSASSFDFAGGVLLALTLVAKTVDAEQRMLLLTRKFLPIVAIVRSTGLVAVPEDHSDLAFTRIGWRLYAIVIGVSMGLAGAATDH